MMTDPERIARIEEKVASLDAAIKEIKEEQYEARNCREESNITMSEIKGQLDALIAKLDTSKQAKYKVTDIILALGMIALTLMQYLKK
jgi:chromosome segregation ATPase